MRPPNTIPTPRASRTHFSQATSQNTQPTRTTRRTSAVSSSSWAVQGPVDDGQTVKQISIKRGASRITTIAPAPTNPQQQQCSQQSFQPRSQQRHSQRESDNGRADTDSSGSQPDSVVQRGANGAAPSSSRALRPIQSSVTPLCQTITPANEFDGHNVWDGSTFGKGCLPEQNCAHDVEWPSEEDGAGCASAGLSHEFQGHLGACADDTNKGVRTKRGWHQRVSASHGSSDENEDDEDPDLSSLVDDPLGDGNLDDNDLGDDEVRLHKRAKKGKGKEAFPLRGKDNLPDWFNMSELRTETRRYLIFKTNWDIRDYSCLISRLGDGQADARLAKVGGMAERAAREQFVSLIKAQHTKLLYDLLEAVAPFVREWLQHEEAGQAYLAGPSTRLVNGKQVPRYPEMLAFKNIVRWSTVEAVYKTCLRDPYLNDEVAKDPTRPFRKGLCKATMALMAFETHRQRSGFEKRKNGTGYEPSKQPELPKRCPGVASQFLSATADVFTAIASDPLIGRHFYKYTTCWKLDPTTKKMVSHDSEPGLLPTPENPQTGGSDPNANKGFKQAAWAADQVDAVQDLDFDHDD